jgi:hypothetical protein
VQQLHHARAGGGFPVASRHRLFEVLLGRIDLHQQARRAALRRAQNQVGAQRLVVFGHAGLQPGGDGLAAEEQIGRVHRPHFQHRPQHVAHPGAVDRRVRLQAALVIGPLLVGGAQFGRQVRVVGVQPLREGFHERRQAQKRAGNFK